MQHNAIKALVFVQYFNFSQFSLCFTLKYYFGKRNAFDKINTSYSNFIPILKQNFISFNQQQIIRMSSVQADFLEISKKVDELMTKMQTLTTKTSSYTAYLGPTGSGKSTLTNYTHNINLTYKKKAGGVYQITREASSKQNPEISIGNGKQSCTQIPNVCEFNGTSSADLVGWFQTRSLKQEIINGFANARVLTKGKKIKIVMVCQINTLLVQKGGIFVQITNILSQVFKQDFKQIIDSTIIIFSKVNTEEWEIQDIKGQIKQIMECNKNLNAQTIALLNHVVQKDRVGIFPTPDRIKDHIEKIKTLINSVKQTTLNHNANISLSPQAYQLKNQFEGILNANSKSITEQYLKLVNSNFVSKKFQNSSLVSNQMKNIRNIQTHVQKMIRQTQNQPEQLSLLAQFDNLVNVNQQLRQKSAMHIKMNYFCKKINKSFDGYTQFVNLISSMLTSSTNQLELQRVRLYNEQQRVIKEQNLRQERIRRQAELLRQRQEQIRRQRQAQQQRQRAQKAQRQQQQRQRIERQQRQAAQRKRIQDQIQYQIDHPPAPVYHHHRNNRNNCQIM